MMQFLALGDSYTIGESVPSRARWPVQLAARLRERGVDVDDAEIVAQTGWTTAELTQAIAQVNPQGPYDLVSLLIGVNNQYLGLDPEQYRHEFWGLLRQAIEFAGGAPQHVIVLSIPDWSVTPFAADDERNREQIAAEIDAFNAVNRTIAKETDVHYVDVAPISRQAASRTDLIATDGLHPSGKMYAAWVELALPVVEQILRGD